MSYPAGVEIDFLEVPSQALENWIWDPTILQDLSRHYVTNEPLPAALMTQLQASRMSGASYKYARQLMMTFFDLDVHGDGDDVRLDPKGLDERWTRMQAEMTHVDKMEGTWPMASWYHIAMGYDAGFYSYLWSEVISHDFFQTKFAKASGGLLDPHVGVAYRDQILAKGAMEDAQTMVQSFLGRPSNDQAFLKVLRQQE